MGITEGILAEVKTKSKEEADLARITTVVKNMLKKGYAKKEIMEILEVEEKIVDEIIETIQGEKAASE